MSVFTEEDTTSLNHPLFLHQQDHPGLVLISKKLNGSEIYSLWRRSMTIVLNAKNKLQTVTGELIEHAAISSNRALWDRTNGNDCRSLDDLQIQFTKIIGDGSNTYFWNEQWIRGNKLSNMFPRLCRLEQVLDATIKDRLGFDEFDAAVD
ncbi:uncharacterized protein [Rutidosis leptorrhynchoides]|uniref:uncharacterized protein n=1 Tax=Rutidosis leptorrhynchoides TaxID=125765 RepID=UPI003A98EAB9